MYFSKFVKWFLVSVSIMVLTACGGGGSSDVPEISETVDPIIEEFNSIPPAKVIYEVKSDVVEYTTTDPIKRADEATTFIAPVSMGLSEGDVFIFENVAYKISMIAADEASDTIKIFTQEPTLDEVVENLEINGSIPFSVPEIDNTSSFNLKAKVTDRKTNKTDAVTFTCRVTNDEVKPEQVENGFSFGVTCTAVSGGATIKIVSTETIKGGVLLDYKKGRSKQYNKIGFAVNIDVESTVSGDYKIEIDNDQDPTSLFRGVAVLGTTPITVSVEYFFLAGVTFDGSATYTRTDNYSYKRMYNFDFVNTEKEQSVNSTNNVSANVTVGAHIGIRPMAATGIFGIDIIGLYVDTKMKETINVSGEVSNETTQFCVTSELYFTLQGGYKIIGGEYRLLGSEYSDEIRTDTTKGCEKVFTLDFLDPVTSCPAKSYYADGYTNKQTKNSGVLPVQYSISDTSNDDLLSELVDNDSYEKIIQIDKTAIGGKTISKVTWEVIDGDMGLEIVSLESDGSRIMLSASDEQGNNATLKATIKATDGTTLSQETIVSRNSKPVAVPRVYISGNDLVLDASSSYDPDGNRIIGYGWFFTDTGKKIVNTNSINKVPLSDLSSPVNLKMAVVSDNQPIELSEVESVSFDIAGSSDLATLLSGNTVYTTDRPDYMESWTFNDDMTTITWNVLVGGSGTSVSPVSVDGMTITIPDDEGDSIGIISEILEDYMLMSIDGGSEQRVYFDEAKARAYFESFTIPVGTLVSENSGNDRDALISPNGGEVWMSGETQTIQWMTQWITGNTVDLYVLHDDPSGLFDKTSQTLGNVVNTKNWYKFATNIQNSGNYVVDPADMSGTGDAYMVLVVSTTDNTKWDISDGTFSLNFIGQP